MQGHPLAIKLTAALVASRSLDSIRDELRKNPPKKYRIALMSLIGV